MSYEEIMRERIGKTRGYLIEILTEKRETSFDGLSR
jgi:hypothetical protein